MNEKMILLIENENDVKRLISSPVRPQTSDRAEPQSCPVRSYKFYGVRFFCISYIYVYDHILYMIMTPSLKFPSA